MNDRDLQEQVRVTARRSGEASGGQARPFRELDTDGTESARAVSTALEAVQERPDRDPKTGQFVKGNQVAGRSRWPARSEAFWSEVSAAKRELAERVLTDLGADDGAAAETLVGVADGYAEARVLRHAMFLRLIELGGPVTTKGKARALFSSYLQALDRETRLAQTLGLERRAKAVSLADAINDRQKAGT